MCSLRFVSSSTTISKTEFPDNFDFTSTIEENLSLKQKQEQEQREREQQQLQQQTQSDATSFNEPFKLPGDERNRLTKMLYKEFFTQSEGVIDGGDIAKKAEVEGMYEARIELNWIIQWAREQNFPTQNAFVRAVQMAVLERVDLHKPLSFIIGTQPFLGCEIRVQSPLLIPRTETEEWVQWWSTKYMRECQAAPLRVLDLCCGTGCIGAAVLRHFPNVEVVGVDIEPLAVRTTIENYKRACQDAIRAGMRLREVDFKERREVAEKALKSRVHAHAAQMRSEEKPEAEIKKMIQEAAETHFESERKEEAIKKKQDEDDVKQLQRDESSGDVRHHPARFTVIQSDMFRHLPEQLQQSFDVILANPPYILPEEYHNQLPKSVRDWESEIALVGDGRHSGKNLLYFKELRDEAPKWLSPTPVTTDYKGPRLMFELGLQAKIMQKLFSEKESQWPRVDLHLDRFEEPRWCECFFQS